MKRYIALLTLSFLSYTTFVHAYRTEVDDITDKITLCAVNKVVGDINTKKSEKIAKIASFIVDQRNRFSHAVPHIIGGTLQLLEGTEKEHTNMLSIFPELKQSPLAHYFMEIQKEVNQKCRNLGVEQKTGEVLLNHFFSRLQSLVEEYDTLYINILSGRKDSKNSPKAFEESLKILRQKKDAILRELNTINP